MSRPPTHPEETVLERFRRTADEQPERPLYVFVDGKGRDEERLTYGRFAAEIDNLTRRLVGELGIRPGERLLLVYPPSADFVTAFVGCLAAGVVPVPVAPPNPFHLAGDLPTFEAVAASSGSVAVLTNGAYLRARRLAAARDLFARRGGAWQALPWHRTDGGAGSAGEVPVHRPELDTPAFLQYTSGSTSEPKGVEISHRNILHQLGINGRDLGLDTASRAVFWVPHFHDFCLVSGILSALYGNGMLYLMSPLTFLRRPHLWLEVLSRVRATHTAAPDFAYRLAMRKTTPEQRRSWDLSALEVAMSAAEPIRPSTVDTFFGGLAEARLSPRAFCPAYGLAEHTVGVSVGGKRRLRVHRGRLEHDGRVETAEAGGPESIELFGCGPPSEQVEVRIVDPETRRRLGDGEVGEIWVDSPSKALGYHGLPELSEEVFAARLAGPGDGRGYLRTGDLGFLYEGEIFVAGRRKDMMIVRGRNVYPQDVEESVCACHPLIRPGRAVAFSIPPAPGGDEERVVVMVEVREKRLPAARLDEIVHAVRGKVVGEHRVHCTAVLVAPPRQILKTTSGKVRRQACRQAYLEGGFAGRLLRS